MIYDELEWFDPACIGMPMIFRIFDNLTCQHCAWVHGWVWICFVGVEICACVCICVLPVCCNCCDWPHPSVVQPTPPEYDVTKITLPIALFTGTKDWLADPQDVKGLIPKLKNIALHKNIETYDHLDFIWGVNAYQTIYPDIVQLFWKYNAN